MDSNSINESFKPSLNTTNNETDMLTSIEKFKYGLTSRATGGGYDNYNYVRMRNLLLNDKRINHLVPQFIKSCRNTDEFWGFIKAKFPTYDERRKYIALELNTIIETIEQMNKKDKNIINNDAYEMMTIKLAPHK